MSILSSTIVYFARRLIPSPISLSSSTAPRLASTPALSSATPSAHIASCGLRSISSVTSTFSARSINSPLISALPQTSTFLGAPTLGSLSFSLPGAIAIETKRFSHPATYKPNAKKRRAKNSFDKRTKTPGGRAVLWRRIIARKPRLAS